MKLVYQGIIYDSNKSTELLEIFYRVEHNNATRGTVLHRTYKKGLYWVHNWSRWKKEADTVQPISTEAFKMITDGYGNSYYDCSDKALDDIISKYFPDNNLEESIDVLIRVLQLRYLMYNLV